MKRIFRIALAALLLAVIALPVSAEEASEVCTVRADSVSGKPGETVIIPVRIENNTGLTNFGIALDYNRELLELTDIRLADEQQAPYLCGSFADAGTSWDPAKDANASGKDDFTRDVTYGYVTCALVETTVDDGVLFAATFRLAEDFAGTAAVTPVVNYIRDQGTNPETFEELQAHTAAGAVNLDVGSVVKPGDVNADGYITADDAASAFAASKDASKLTEEQKDAADVTGDGYITADDAAQIFALSKSNQ